MRHPIDRRTAVAGLAGAALGGSGMARSYGQGDPAWAPAPERGVGTLRTALPSVTDKGAKGDGVTMNGATIQDALNAFDTIWVPPGVYMIDVPLILPSYSVLMFASGAIFCPAYDGMTIFRTREVSYASRIVAPRIHGRGKRGITAFDLKGFRHRAEIQHADIWECEHGIILRELCWDTVLHMPWIRQTQRPITIGNGSNAVDVIHPGLDDFDIGIQIENGPTHATTATRIWGGYIQNGRVGVVDSRAIGTVIDGTYFEGLREADILLSRAVRPNVSRTQHYGETGRVAIRSVTSDSATIFDPVMSSGARTLGLYDIDAGSTNLTRFENASAASLNAPLGNVGNSGIMVRETGGAFEPTLSVPMANTPVYVQRRGHWRRSGSQWSMMIDLRWAAIPSTGELVVSGIPATARPPQGAIVHPASVAMKGAGSGTDATARWDDAGNLRIFTASNGRETAARIVPDSGLSVSIHAMA